jgi:hypothetical protein
VNILFVHRIFPELYANLAVFCPLIQPTPSMA